MFFKPKAASPSAQELCWSLAFTAGWQACWGGYDALHQEALQRARAQGAAETKRALAATYEAKERALLSANGLTVTAAAIQALRTRIIAQLRVAQRAQSDTEMAKWTGAQAACDELLHSENGHA